MQLQKPTLIGLSGTKDLSSDRSLAIGTHEKSAKSFNELRACTYRRRNREPESLGGAHIQGQRYFFDLLNWNAARIGTLENLVDKYRNGLETIIERRPVAQQAACFG